MSNSIWDTRFNSGRRGVARDADEGDQQWITINGARVLVDGDGNVVGGAEGKFNGANYKEERAKAQEKKAEEQSNKNGAEHQKRSREDFEMENWMWDFVHEKLNKKDTSLMSDDELKHNIKEYTEKAEKYKEKGYYPSIIEQIKDKVTEWKQGLAASEYRQSHKDVKGMSEKSLLTEYKDINQKLKEKPDRLMRYALTDRRRDIDDELNASYPKWEYKQQTRDMHLWD